MLLVNGCSFTYGDELEGCNDDPPTHWPRNWASKLSNHLGFEEPPVNLATCGGGNEKIFRDLTVYLADAQPGKRTMPTHIVVMWSGFTRHEVAESREVHNEKWLNIKRYDDMTQYSPERIDILDESKWGAMYMYIHKGHEPRTDILHTLTFMLSLQNTCDTLGIKLIQGAFHKMMYDMMIYMTQENGRDKIFRNWQKQCNEHLGRLKKESRIGMGHWTDLYTLAKENYTIHEHNHPDEDAHTEYSTLLYHIFEQME